ncbi:MAG TPA: quinone oxidoreductase [Verrucomicrobiales bacterium]|nr:quinone oxidoreductase [Verrucomicrobiales bacterium]
MKAAFIKETGPASNLQFGDVPKPVLRHNQVLVRVTAVSVNPIDTYIRAGLVPMELPKPFIVGCDLAGVVEGVGSDVKRFQPGDRVWGSNQGLLGRQGTFAEYAAVDECFLYPTPGDVPDEQAAAIALVGITAHLGLVREARLHPHETVFVNGGSGGVGSTVIQMAKAIGAKVFASAGSDEKVAACLKLGADAAFNYKTTKLGDELKKVAAPGVNVWWETTREPDFDLAVGALAARGRMIVMAGREARPPFPVGPFYVKGCSIHGFVMFLAPPEEQRKAAVDINQWLSTGKLEPKIDRVLSLSEAAKAHQLQEDATIKRSGALAGKLVLIPGTKKGKAS